MLLVELGFAESRTRAQGLLLAGQVLVGDSPMDKAGTRVLRSAAIRLGGVDHPYVGRGGVKLEGALADLGVDPAGTRCLDVGASTGGFTDCLLRAGACHVVAIDVGTNQLAWRLRQDLRVTSMEGTDVRDLRRSDLGGEIDLVVIDASFISLRLVLPPLIPLLRQRTPVLALVKPQFEVGRSRVGKGGVVRDDEARRGAVDGVIAVAAELGLRTEGQADCRIAGAKAGNREIFLLLRLA